jgi:hypothetical protein
MKETTIHGTLNPLGWLKNRSNKADELFLNDLSQIKNEGDKNLYSKAWDRQVSWRKFGISCVLGAVAAGANCFLFPAAVGISSILAVVGLVGSLASVGMTIAASAQLKSLKDQFIKPNKAADQQNKINIKPDVSVSPVNALALEKSFASSALYTQALDRKDFWRTSTRNWSLAAVAAGTNCFLFPAAVGISSILAVVGLVGSLASIAMTMVASARLNSLRDQLIKSDKASAKHGKADKAPDVSLSLQNAPALEESVAASPHEKNQTSMSPELPSHPLGKHPHQYDGLAPAVPKETARAAEQPEIPSHMLGEHPHQYHGLTPAIAENSPSVAQTEPAPIKKTIIPSHHRSGLAADTL